MTKTITESQQNNPYSKKLSTAAGSLSALYLLPAIAEAAIVHQTTPLTISLAPITFSNVNVSWDIDGDTLADFNLFARNTYFVSFYTTSGGGGFSNLVLANGTLGMDSFIQNGRGLVQQVGDSPSQFRNLPLGAFVPPISATNYQISPFSQSRNIINSSFSLNSIAGGAQGFSGGGNEYIGFTFISQASGTPTLAFGWAEIDLDIAVGAASMTITQWAYEDTGGPIQVGQVSPVPLPSAFVSMLSGLALGAGGVLRARRQKKATQEKGSNGRTFEHA